MPPPPPKPAGLLASRWWENRAQLALTSVFVAWGTWLAAKKLVKDNPEELRHDPEFEAHRGEQPQDAPTGSERPAYVTIPEKAGMVVEAKPGDDRDADPIAAHSGGIPLVAGVFPNAAITKSRIGDATPAGRCAAEREAERAKK